MSRGSKGIYKCARCQQPFEAREADRKRGWARFCSKSCKAVRQTQLYGPHRDEPDPRDMYPIFSAEALGQDR